MKRFCARLFAWLLCLSVIASCSREAPIEQQGTYTLSVTADVPLVQNVDWPMKGHDDTDSHFSPLKQISTANIDRLGLAWSLDLTDERGALEATPLAVDGVIYFPGSGSVVYAIDAVSGKPLWNTIRRLPKTSTRACCALSSGRTAALLTVTTRFYLAPMMAGCRLWMQNQVSCCGVFEHFPRGVPDSFPVCRVYSRTRSLLVMEAATGATGGMSRPTISKRASKLGVSIPRRVAPRKTRATR